ncbi:hypothetical protein SESBI_38588 [Sesbania bispinosa]|nr:hypothetical protein SESBI_38588 [Sesbania bispinosa]
MARFVAEMNNLTVTSTEKIKGTNDSTIGNNTVLAWLERRVPKDNQKSCKEFDEFVISFKSKPEALPTIVLPDRGSKILVT